jgi:RNA polymerase sigma factor (sigma-70 family)
MSNDQPALVKMGQQRWQENIVEDLYPALQRYCYFISKNKWDGDDLAQEVFMKAIQVYPISDLKPALLSKIAYHQWIDTLRKRAREQVGVSTNKEIEQDKTNIYSIDTVDHLIQKLTPKQAVTFLLKEGFKYQANEVARLLGMTETAVKATIHRAKRRFEKDEPQRLSDSYWNEDEKQVLYDLIHQSLVEDDPQVLIDYFSAIPSLFVEPKPVNSSHSPTPLFSYCLAA